MRRLAAPWVTVAVGVVALAAGLTIGRVSAPSRSDERRNAETGPGKAPSAASATPGPEPAGSAAQLRHPGTPAEGSRLSFSGEGPRKIGTLTVSRAGTLEWTSDGGRFQIIFGNRELGTTSTAHSGRIFAPAGTYRDVRIRALGHWTLRSR